MKRTLYNLGTANTCALGICFANFICAIDSINTVNPVHIFVPETGLIKSYFT